MGFELVDHGKLHGNFHVFQIIFHDISINSKHFTTLQRCWTPPVGASGDAKEERPQSLGEASHGDGTPGVVPQGTEGRGVVERLGGTSQGS